MDIQFENLIFWWITVMLMAALVCFFVSEITGNYSQVDKLWSIMPIVYSIITLFTFPSPRLWIMSILIAMWGIRLSFNFYRKGGYNIIPWKGEEDYRWKIMRNHPKLKGRLRFTLFNLIFISFYQHFLILLISTPLLIAAKYSNATLSIIDFIAASLFLVFLLTETVADNQQFKFQNLKKMSEKSRSIFGESLKNGFLSEGLWRLVRHPNYASEQAIWIVFYLFGVAASDRWFNWTLTGSVLLVLLFLGSTHLTESISSDKYPAYNMYRKSVPKFFPRIIRTSDSQLMNQK